MHSAIRRSRAGSGAARATVIDRRRWYHAQRPPGHSRMYSRRARSHPPGVGVSAAWRYAAGRLARGRAANHSSISCDGQPTAYVVSLIGTVNSPRWIIAYTVERESPVRASTCGRRRMAGVVSVTMLDRPVSQPEDSGMDRDDTVCGCSPITYALAKNRGARKLSAPLYCAVERLAYGAIGLLDAGQSQAFLKESYDRLRVCNVAVRVFSYTGHLFSSSTLVYID